MGFVHLHNHTEYSLLSGACRLCSLIERAKELGQEAVALTDEFNLFGAVKFFCVCKKFGLKPIIGCEIAVYGSENLGLRSFKLVVLCENRIGYENLVKIVSFANTQKANETVAVSFDYLAGHSSGLIALSSSLDGEIANAFFSFGYDRAKMTVEKYAKIFGSNSFFLELQNHGLDREKKLNKFFYRISCELNLELVVTNNVYYVYRSDAIVQKMLSSIKFAKLFSDENFNCLPNDEFYLKSEEEMKLLFCGFEKAIKNTEKVAKRCCFEFEFNAIQVPKFKLDSGLSCKDLLLKKAKSGLFLKYGNKPSELVLKRFSYEFGIVVKMGFVDYFLIVQDYVNFARKSGITVGPGRGSGAGSLLAFCLNITSIDPIKYGLSFERFLNPDRKKMPDFDVDFCNERRQEVLNYVIKKYGKNCVSQIVTFGTLAAKAAVRDVTRILGFEVELADKISKLIPNRVKVSLKEALYESDKLRNMVTNDARVELIFKNACLIEGYLRNTSTHAAAVVFAKNNLGTYVPLVRNENVVLTQYAMDDLAVLGFLKMDFLGLRNLTIIGKCEKLIKKKFDRNFSVEKINLNDERTFSLLSKGDSVGVFQLESKLTRKILIRFKPKNLEHLMIVISLNRPGPAQFIDLFLSDKKNFSGSINLNFNAKVKEILKSTKGIVLFQEQVMQIFKEVAGYSFGRIDLIRMAITEKREELIEKEREVFLFGFRNLTGDVESVGAVNLGVSVQEAEKIFQILTRFSAYAFNKSHAAAYSLIAYRTAYLKANFSAIYMSCLLNSVVLTNRSKMLEYLAECERFKIKILPLNINTSGVYFDVLKNGELSFSFLAVKGVGKFLAQQIIIERSSRLFSSIEDFFNRMSSKNLNKFAVDCLIKNGAFSDFEQKKKVIFDLSKRFLNDFGPQRLQVEGQISLFSDFFEQEKTENFVAKVLLIKSFTERFSEKKFIIIKLFCRFKAFYCLISEFLFKSLNFRFYLGDYFKFCCVETKIGSKKFFEVKKVEKLSDVDQKNLVLVIKLRHDQIRIVGKLKSLFLRFSGSSMVFFLLANNDKYGMRYFKKMGFEKIKLNGEVFSELESIFGKGCFKIELKN